MNKYLVYILILLNTTYLNDIFAQEIQVTDSITKVSRLFIENTPLAVELAYSIKELKKNTNDSTYAASSITFREDDGAWNTLPVEMRTRGNYRLNNCYFPPIKLKFKKRIRTGTLFEGNKTLKVVLPCLVQRDMNDNVMKEYLAYQMFELLSPYHFKTRLMDINFKETRGKKIKAHELRGFFIEDDKNVAKRVNGDVYKRRNHPLNHQPHASVRNALFQFMIGNTDYSSAYQHNTKVIFADKAMIPLPYDFDMSGFVNCSYAVVSQIQGKDLGMSSVTQRLYRGFVRERQVFEEVRNEFITKKMAIVELLNAHQSYFDSVKEFEVAKEYILSFFRILEDDKKFERNIIEKARKK